MGGGWNPLFPNGTECHIKIEREGEGDLLKTEQQDNGPTNNNNKAHFVSEPWSRELKLLHN